MSWIHMRAFRRKHCLQDFSLGVPPCATASNHVKFCRRFFCKCFKHAEQSRVHVARIYEYHFTNLQEDVHVNNGGAGHSQTSQDK